MWTLQRRRAPEASSFVFGSWSDGGPAQHAIVTPPGAATYTATFTAVSPPSGLRAAYGFNEGSGECDRRRLRQRQCRRRVRATWVDGRFGKALSFDGVNDLVTVNGSNSLEVSPAL